MFSVLSYLLIQDLEGSKVQSAKCEQSLTPLGSGSFLQTAAANRIGSDRRGGSITKYNSLMDNLES